MPLLMTPRAIWRAIHTDGIQCGAFLSLNEPRAAYDKKSIEAIADYANTAVSLQGAARTNVDVVSGYLGVAHGTSRGGQAYRSVLLSPPTADVPSTLSWAPGGESCFGQLEVTNVTENAMVISSIGATLTRDSAPNTINYQLIDTCTLPGQICTPPGGAQPGCLYVARVQLSGGRHGDHTDARVAPFKADDQCPTLLTLNAHQAQEINVVATSKPQHLVYDVNLTVTVNGVKHDLPTALTQSLTFIDDTSKVSCFAYQAGQFVIQQPVKETDSNEWTRNCL